MPDSDASNAVAIIKFIAEELVDQIMQRKNNEQHTAGNIDVFFELLWINFFRCEYQRLSERVKPDAHNCYMNGCQRQVVANAAFNACEL